MRSIGYNFDLLEIMLEDFEAYILSSAVFWPLSSKGKKVKTSALPRLTLGGLFLTLDELASQKPEMDRHQDMAYRKLLRKLDRLTSKWQVAIEKKAQQELKSRVNLWKAFLGDLEEDLEHIEEYPREVRTRIMISHLINLSRSKHQIEDQLQIVHAIDMRMEAYVRPDSFLLDEQLKESYPQEDFPFLYRSPRS
jgi:hypothetical protein